MRRIVYNKVFTKIMLTETVCLTLSSVTYSLVNNVWLGMHPGHSFFYSYQQNKVKSVVVGYHHLSMFRKFAVCTRSGNKIPTTNKAISNIALVVMALYVSTVAFIGEN